MLSSHRSVGSYRNSIVSRSFDSSHLFCFILFLCYVYVSMQLWMICIDKRTHAIKQRREKKLLKKVIISFELSSGQRWKCIFKCFHTISIDRRIHTRIFCSVIMEWSQSTLQTSYLSSVVSVININFSTEWVEKITREWGRWKEMRNNKVFFHSTGSSFHCAKTVLDCVCVWVSFFHAFI